MKIYKIVYTEDAIKHLNSIYDYIFYVLKNPNGARNTYNKIVKAVNSLDTFPLGNPIIKYKNKRNVVFHRKLVGNYSIIYSVEKDDTVMISYILYTSSDINTILNC